MGKWTLIRGHVAISKRCKSQGGDGRVMLRDQAGEGSELGAGSGAGKELGQGKGERERAGLSDQVGRAEGPG